MYHREERSAHGRGGPHPKGDVTGHIEVSTLVEYYFKHVFPYILQVLYIFTISFISFY